MKNRAPNMAKNTRVTATEAAVNRGLAKNETSRIGWSQRCSHNTKAARSTPARTKAPAMVGRPQPADGPSMIPYSSARRPVVDSTVPSRSRRGAPASRELGTMAIAPTMAAATMGTLTRKIDPHQKCCRRNPPASGPMATPSPDTPAHIEMARARSPGSPKTLIRIESVAGMMNAAPKPCRPRIRIRVPALCTSEQAREPLPKTTKPPMKQPLRPRRSPVLPAISRKLAKMIV